MAQAYYGRDAARKLLQMFRLQIRSKFRPFSAIEHSFGFGVALEAAFLTAHKYHALQTDGAPFESIYDYMTKIALPIYKNIAKWNSRLLIIMSEGLRFSRKSTMRQNFYGTQIRTLRNGIRDCSSLCQRDCVFQESRLCDRSRLCKLWDTM